MKSTSTLSSRTVVYGFGFLLERLIGFAIVSLLTKNLHMEGYGAWAQIIANTVLITSVLLLGFQTATVRFLAGNTDKKAVSSVFHQMAAIVLLNSFICILVFLVLRFPLSELIFGDRKFVSYIVPFSLWLTSEACFELVAAFLRAKNKIYLLTFYYLIKNLLRFSALAVGLFVMKKPLDQLILAISVVQICLVLAIYFQHIFRSMGFHLAFPSKLLREILSFSLPLVPYGIFIWCNLYISRHFILHKLNIDQVGVYSVTYTLAGSVNLLYSILGYTLYPHLSKEWNQENYKTASKALQNSVEYFLFFSIPLITFLAIFHKELVRLMATRAYETNWQVIVWLGMAFVMFGLYQLNQYSFMLAKKTFLSLKLSIVAALLNFLLNLWLIPKLHLVGPALAAFLSNSFLAIATYAYSRRNVPYNFPWRALTRIGLATLLITVLVSKMNLLVIQDIWNVMFGLIIGVTIYILFDVLGKRSLLLQLIYSFKTER